MIAPAAHRRFGLPCLLLAAGGLAACAARSFDNPVDPDNQMGELRLSTFYEASALQPAGVEFEEELLWIVDASDSSIHRQSASDGRFDFRRDLSELGPLFGVASDGTFLWLTQPGGTVVRVNPFDGELVQPPLPTPGSDPRGVAFDGAMLWILDGADLSLSMVDPRNGSSSPPVSVPTIGSPGGMTFRGTELWVVDQLDNRLVRLGFDGGELASFRLPTNTGAVGLATDGERFFSSDRSGRINVVEFLEDGEP